MFRTPMQIIIILKPDDEEDSDQDGELVPESGTISNASWSTMWSIGRHTEQ